jgi:probable rRNA maturation factor
LWKRCFVGITFGVTMGSGSDFSRTATRAPAGLAFDVHARTGRAYVAYLRKHLPRAHRLLKSPLREMSLALVGDRRMAKLHQRFMGIAGPTDVLTFELDHDARGRVTAGEVVVCVPYAVRQARRTGVAVRKELLLYALHGMLHLCGFDDRTARDFAAMHEREDDILKRLGVGVVFARKAMGKTTGKRVRLPMPPKQATEPGVGR